MATNNDSNKKLPNPPSEVSGNKDARDIEVFLRPDGKGSQIYAPFEFEEAKQYSFEEIWDPMGSYSTTEAHKKTVLKTSLSYESRNYSIGGHSSSHETHAETYVQDTNKLTVEGDNSTEIGKNNYQVGAGINVSSFLEGTIEDTGPGRSEAPTYRVSSGDHTQEHSGHYHQSFGKDNVQAVSGNKITIVENGDNAMHVQSGNWDTHIAKKARFYSGDDILIESETKITLKVGNSRIIIEPDHIQIISNNKTGLIDLN